MSWEEEYEIRSLSPDVTSDRELVASFLARYDLAYEPDIDYTIGIFLRSRLVATGSLSGRVIKSVAIDADVRGENITGKVLSYLKLTAYHRGIDSLFLFTTPPNVDIFTSVGFSVLAETDDVALLEDNRNTFRLYLDRLADSAPAAGDVAALVMNCNPFTLGHRYLVERAAAEHPRVVLFVVEEDRSVFPFADRLQLVREGVADLTNVTVIPGGEYIISNATFPSYFLKESQNINRIHAELDLTLFGESIAPALGITRRYVGHEPYCPVTAMYNETMQRILPRFGVDVVEIERQEHRTEPISASEVRRRIAAGNVAATKELVPAVTYTYLTSSASAQILARLQEGDA